MDIKADKEQSDARYAAAKSIAKKLSKFGPAEVLAIMQHVGVEFKFSVVPLNAPLPAVAGKVG